MTDPADHSEKIFVEIYSKPGCHLCDEAKDVIGEVKHLFNLEIKEVNIEGDEELFEKYQFDIPVIFINGRKAFKYRMDAGQLKVRLEKEKS